VKEKLANGVGSQNNHTTLERGVSSVTNADAAHPGCQRLTEMTPPPL